MEAAGGSVRPPKDPPFHDCAPAFAVAWGFPRLRIALSHGGGTLQALLPRLQYAWDHLSDLFDASTVNPSDAVRRMYCDALVYDAPTLRRLIDVFGMDRVLVGTDYPFPIMDKAPLGKLSELNLSDADRERICVHNARRWLGEA